MNLKFNYYNFKSDRFLYVNLIFRYLLRSSSSRVGLAISKGQAVVS